MGLLEDKITFLSNELVGETTPIPADANHLYELNSKYYENLAGSNVWHVYPGQSIQAAVDAAAVRYAVVGITQVVKSYPGAIDDRTGPVPDGVELQFIAAVETDYDGIDVHDTFTEATNANLTAHTGEIGATWTKGTSAGYGDLLVNAALGAVTDNGASRAICQPSGTPLAGNYDVLVDYKIMHNTRPHIGLFLDVGRQDMTAAQTANYCAFTYSGASDNGWQLRQRITVPDSDDDTVLFADAVATGEAYAIRVRARNIGVASSSIVPFIDKVAYVSGAIGATKLFSLDPTFNAVGFPSISNYYTDSAAWCAVDNYKLIEAAACVDESIIVCHGNSNTKGSVTHSRDRYPTQLMTEFGDEWLAYNLGTNSIQTTEMATEAAALVDALYSANNKNNILVVWEGVNHIRIGGATAAEAYAALRSYCLARKAVGWNVVLITLSNNDDKPGYPAIIADTNALLRTNYRGFADALVDLDTVPLLTTLNDTTYWDGALHFNAAGLTVIAGMVADAVRSVSVE